jgi:CBS domain-containing protein
VDTSAINYRVADFLKEHPPFQGMDMSHLLTFAQLGRVKFFEAHQFILTQGSSRYDVFVIQQGTVLLWDERSAEARLLDVRGAGAMLGIEGFNERSSFPYSARSANDVLVYTFPAHEFDALVEKYTEARQYVSAYGRAGGDYRSHDQNDPHTVSLRNLSGARQFVSCDVDASIREAGQRMLDAKADVLVLIDANGRGRGLMTARSFVEWAAVGKGNLEQPAVTLCSELALTMSGDASVATAVLALAAVNAPALITTANASPGGQVQGLVTPEELGAAFGDRPHEILRNIQRSTNVEQLRDANLRSRLLARRYLTSGASTVWLSAYLSLIDAAILKRIVAMTAETASLCWCFCGRSGRAESLTSEAPDILVLMSDDDKESDGQAALKRVHESIAECGYIPASEDGFEASFHAAALSSWKQRYLEWIADPIRKKIYLARRFFDLRPIAGNESLCKELEAHVFNAVSREFLYIAANDCLGTLPPLTFFQNAVVDESGEERSVFRLEETALNPLVDVARVFGMATGKVFSSSTLDRFGKASRVHPEDALVFEEASATFRTVLWQQGRVGLAQRSSGAELPPALLSPYDRQVLRNGFQSISRLLQWFENLEWVKNV